MSFYICTCLFVNIDLIVVSDDYYAETIDYLLENSIKPSTRSTYKSAFDRFERFCDSFGLESLPASHSTLVYYVSHLFDEKLKGSTIKVYLSAIRHYHIKKDKENPLQSGKLELILRAAMSLSGSPNRKLPISYKILCELCDLAKNRYDGKMMCAAMSLAYFACLRAGELCLPDSMCFDPTIHLAVQNVCVNMQDKWFVLHISRSKTDKFNQGVSVHVGCSQKAVCAFCFMVDYLKTRQGESFQPLFVDPYNNVLTKSHFVSSVRIMLSLTGRNPKLYSGHSFRAGAATDASDNEFQSHEIKMLGRWASDAFNLYLRNPKRTSKFSKRLALTNN